VSDYHINVFFSEDDGGYIADIPDLDACSAFGETPEQAVAEVLRAKEAWLAEAGQGIPEPRYRPASTSAEVTAQVHVEDGSGPRARVRETRGIDRGVVAASSV
jgi:predicted RNase H-like HicB family nuclease